MVYTIDKKKSNIQSLGRFQSSIVELGTTHNDPEDTVAVKQISLVST